MEAAAEKTLGFFWLPPESRQSALADLLRLDRAEDHLKFIIGLQACLYAKYQHQFAGLVSFKYKFTPLGSTNIDIGGFLIPYEPQLDPGKRWASSTAAGLSYFTKIIKDWTQKPYVDSIDPQIYAQNISDVSSKTKLVDVAFAVSAVLGKAGTLSDNARSLNQSQTLLQAIKRQPLSVSYASGTNFGWMMGPSYTIQDGKAVFLQSFEKESFSAAIVLPVWARALKLNGQVTWLGDDGTPARTDPLELQTVDLPSDLDALTSAIQERQAAHLPKPTLYASELSLQAGAKGDQTLLIFGRELWRNPEVFFGSTKADTVDLLPDMKGLLAHFSSVPTNSSTNVDLTVVTSFGSASLDNAVIISPPEKRVVAASGPPAKMMTAFAVNGSIPLYFGLNTNVISPGYAGFSFKLSLPEKPGDWVKIDDSAATLSSNGTRLSISVKLPDPQPPTPVKYTLDLGIRRTPYESPTSLLADTKSNLDSFVYFPAKDEEKPKLSLPNPAIIAYKPEGPDVPSMVLRPADSVKLADLYAAYPGLQTSVKSGAAKFSLKAAGQDPRTFLLKEDSGGCLVAVPAKVEDLPAATYDTITIEYQAVGTVTVNLPVLGGPITVKKQ
jgi:hypothetical protein